MNTGLVRQVARLAEDEHTNLDRVHTRLSGDWLTDQDKLTACLREASEGAGWTEMGWADNQAEALIRRVEVVRQAVHRALIAVGDLERACSTADRDAHREGRQ